MPKDKHQSTEKPDLTAARKEPNILNPARIYEVPEEPRHLDPTQLARLEEDFRSWAEAAPRRDVRTSRKRILLIFLLIRYTGARLHEVLALDLAKHIDFSRGVVLYGNADAADSSSEREVQISSELLSEIHMALADPIFAMNVGSLLMVDEGHVRRKFYERAVACDFAQDLASPNSIRRARAVELMQGNMPLPVVQRVLGHSTPNLTASLVSFSEDDIHHVERHFIERESTRKTSARNTFFGKVGTIKKGDIQSQVDLVTLGGDVVTTVITNNSLQRLGLKVGALIAAEVKAPWVIVHKAEEIPVCTAENMFFGTVTQVLRGKLTTELIVRIRHGSELCSVVTEESRRKLGIKEEDKVWAVFNSFAVILRVD
jgi:molybdate transport system regulatory protein